MMNIPRRQPPSRPNCTDSRAHTTPHEVTLHTGDRGERGAMKEEQTTVEPDSETGSEVECDAPSTTTERDGRRDRQKVGHH
jgi:hypothetical protein